MTAHTGPVLGGGPAGFRRRPDRHRSLIEVLDEGSGRYQGIEPDAPEGVVF